MSINHKEKTHRKRWLLASGGTAITVFSWELIEEALENVIALGISSVIAVFSTFILVCATQGIKLGIKRLTKFLFPIIKSKIYKEGNDKMNRLKTAWNWLVANKGTIGGIVTAGVTVASGVGLIDVSALPELIIGSVNITPILYYIILGTLTIVTSFFPETIEKYKARIAEKKAEKELAQLTKVAKKELATEEKLANQTQAEQDKAKAKAEAEELAKAEKEKSDAEYRSKVDAIKAQLTAEKTNN